MSFDRKQAQFKSRQVVICLPDRIVWLNYLIESFSYPPLFPSLMIETLTILDIRTIVLYN